MSSDVFVIASARDSDAAAALRQAVERAGIEARRVEDVILGFDEVPGTDRRALLAAAGLACPYSAVTPSLRAVFFAAKEILSEGAQIVLAAGVSAQGTAAILLGSPEVVGRLNLLPCARLAAHSLSGLDDAMQFAEIKETDIEITKHGGQPVLMLHDLLEELESRDARWGTVTSGELALLVERL